ncbi:hypothetical protein PVIIG_06065 [Plasmodium vivax India VII]|nr:hypothetical protein PVIIG_06065 [Plasmodium vivax India VII]
MGGDSAFGWQNQTECCKYVNYWLNGQVENNIITLYNEKSFKIFQDIVKLYSKNNPNKTRCINDIRYIDPKYLRKMGALYNLYDKYNSLINYNKWLPYKECDIIEEASRLFYDHLVVYCDEDKNFLKRLKQFKVLMDAKLPLYSCSRHHSTYFIIPKRFSEPEVNQRQKEDSKQEPSAHALVSGTEQEKQQILDSQMPSGNLEVKILSESVTLEREAEDSGDSRLVTETSSQEDLDSYGQLSHSLDGIHSVGENSMEGRYSVAGSLSERRDSVKVRHLHEGEHNDFLQDRNLFNLRGHTSATDSLRLQNTLGQQIDDPGLLGKMKTALSTMVESVDPGPVLGVSGGMGALFLLFKYTPVGSFFGGRRGRFRQIRRTFGGFPLGDFANLQQYGGGYVGYSQMDMPFQGE